MDESLAEHCDKASTIRFGNIEVWLWRRRAEASASFPCAEVLHVGVANVNECDVEAYIRFHNAFVTHRVKEQWPHQFALVYDTRHVDVSSKWVSIVEQTAAFALMHSALGDHYKSLLHKVVVQLVDASLAQRIRALQAPFVDETSKPVHFVTTETLATTFGAA